MTLTSLFVGLKAGKEGKKDDDVVIIIVVVVIIIHKIMHVMKWKL